MGLHKQVCRKLLDERRIKMTIKEIRDSLGISRAEFSRRYHIPLRTLDDWEKERRTPPPYVLELLEYRVKNESLE